MVEWRIVRDQGQCLLLKKNQTTKPPLFLRVFVTVVVSDKYVFLDSVGQNFFLVCCFCEAVLAQVLISCAWWGERGRVVIDFSKGDKVALHGWVLLNSPALQGLLPAAKALLANLEVLPGWEELLFGSVVWPASWITNAHRATGHLKLCLQSGLCPWFPCAAAWGFAGFLNDANGNSTWWHLSKLSLWSSDRRMPSALERAALTPLSSVSIPAGRTMHKMHGWFWSWDQGKHTAGQWLLVPVRLQLSWFVASWTPVVTDVNIVMHMKSWAGLRHLSCWLLSVLFSSFGYYLLTSWMLWVSQALSK